MTAERSTSHNVPRPRLSEDQVARLARPGYTRSVQSQDKSLQSYCNIFHCDIGELFAGKRLLDLGSGARAALAKSLRPHVDVVSLNPNWTLFDKPAPKGVAPVQGIAEQLPFKSEVFDGVLACWSIPKYLTANPEHYQRAFRELHRVLAPDGFALLAPIPEACVSHLAKTLPDILPPDSYQYHYDERNIVLSVAKHAGVYRHPDLQQLWVGLEPLDAVSPFFSRPNR